MEYTINDMIVDDNFDSEEYVTVDFVTGNKKYSITFKKADLVIMNSWVFESGTSFPADLPEELIESIRKQVKKKIKTS